MLSCLPVLPCLTCGGGENCGSAVNKNRMLAGRGNGPHPYETGADWVQRYFKVMQHCARAAQLGLERKLADPAARQDSLAPLRRRPETSFSG
jgi:hypothetical protein